MHGPRGTTRYQIFMFIEEEVYDGPYKGRHVVGRCVKQMAAML